MGWSGGRWRGRGGAEGPVDRGSGDVEPGELEGAADHGEDQRAGVESGGEVAALLEAQGGEQADCGPVLCKAGSRGEGRWGGGTAVREEGEGDTVGGARLGAVQLERGAGNAEAGPCHALDGEQHVGLEVHGLADQDQVERQRIAGGEVPWVRCLGIEPGLEDVGSRGGAQPAQERRRLALDEGLEDPRVDARLPQPAALARLLGTHRADRPPQGVPEGAAEHRALVRRQMGGGEGAEGEVEAEVGDGREGVGEGNPRGRSLSWLERWPSSPRPSSPVPSHL
jgi:hypothetical protein